MEGYTAKGVFHFFPFCSTLIIRNRQYPTKGNFLDLEGKKHAYRLNVYTYKIITKSFYNDNKFLNKPFLS